MVVSEESVAPVADRTWVLAVLALTGAAFVLLFTVVPHAATADGAVRFLKLDTLLREGTLRGERFSYIGPLFASHLLDRLGRCVRCGL